MKKTIFILFSIILLGSCTYIMDLKRSGDEKIVEYSWNGATSIEILAPCRLILVNNETQFIKIEGMDYIVDGYELLQTDDELVIDHKEINWLQEDKIANITLGAPTFRSVIFNSPGKITTLDTLKIGHFQLVINGKGIYTTSDMRLKGGSLSLSVYGGINKSSHHLSGEVKSVQYTMEGGTDINALKLKTEVATIVQKSYGNIFLYVRNKLIGKIYSTGNIYYTGEPQMEVEIIENAVMQASGKVIPY